MIGRSHFLDSSRVFLVVVDCFSGGGGGKKLVRQEAEMGGRRVGRMRVLTLTGEYCCGLAL